jgi:hypothetical protein
MKWCTLSLRLCQAGAHQFPEVTIAATGHGQGGIEAIETAFNDFI